MGVRKKKKNPDSPSSVLSESEIQKKLYGEFSSGAAPVVTGDGESSKEAVTVAPKESLPGKPDPALDLFSAQRDVLSEDRPSPRKLPPEPKPVVESAPRLDPVPVSEKKTPSPAVTITSPVNQDAYSRFPYNRPRESKAAVVRELWNGIVEKAHELVSYISDPKQVVVRRAFYWVAAVLIVFILFWGVNALNSQREEAMQTRYKISGEKAPVKVPMKAPAREAVAIPSEPVAERPVVITPAPVKRVKARPEGTDQAAVAPSTGPYVIQVVTYPTRQDAEQIVNVFTRAGLRAFVKEDARSSGRVFYLVLLGGFRTAADAQAELTKFRTQEVARPFQDAFVKTNRS